MASESAPHRITAAHSTSEPRGQIILFPDRRSFGPFSWRTIRIASFTILVLLLSGALLELFLGRGPREALPAAHNASRVPS